MIKFYLRVLSEQFWKHYQAIPRVFPRKQKVERFCGNKYIIEKNQSFIPSFWVGPSW